MNRAVGAHTVAIVVAVEEPALIPMQRIVDSIEIEDDLFRRLLMGIKEEIDEQRLDRGRVVAHLVITRRFGSAQFQPVSVDLPASGAQSERCAASLCASTANTGSWRRSSWSFRSS